MYRLKGIYAIEIDGKYYIGKDHQIDKMKRYNEHIKMLNKGIHYNSDLQLAFDNSDKNIKYIVFEVYEDDEISRKELCEREMYYIDKFQTYTNGYNKTLGGEGGRGIKWSDQRKEKYSLMFSGENNPMSKLTEEDFFDIVEMLKEGRSNSDIAHEFNLHNRYVSLIRHKKRYKHLWKYVDDYVPTKSSDTDTLKSLTVEDFITVVNMINNGATNAEVERKFNLAAGTGSRIRHRKLYKDWFKKYIDAS